MNEKRGFLALLIWVGLLASSPGWAAFKVALVLDKGGKDDKSFNSAAYAGANRARDELHFFLKFVEASDDNSFEPLIRSFSQKDFDLIIAIGVSQAEALKKVAQAFPAKHYAIVDAEVNLPNVRSLLFEEHEGSYLVGAAAALASKSAHVGFIGGMDIPLIRRFELAYVAGAKKINPKIKTTSNFIGISGEAWNNPAKAKELAVSQYDSGTDVIFAAAGASNTGVFDAAEEKKKLAIGVDSNQNWIKPGFILTSMLKRVDVAVQQACEDMAKAKFEGGTRRFGLKNEGIDFAVDQYNQTILTSAARTKLAELKAEIISGKIKVPDYYQTRK